MSKDPDLKYMAQWAFVTYLRSIHLRQDKEIFDVSKLPIEDFSVSLGLPTAPRIRFLKRSGSKLKKMETVSDEHGQDPEDSERSENEDASADGADKDFLQHVTSGKSKQVKQHSKLNYHFNNKDSGILSLEYEKMRSRNDAEGDDVFFTKRRPIEDGDTERTSHVYMNHLALWQLIPVCPNTVNTNSSTLISMSSSEKRSKGVKDFHYNFMKVFKAS